MTTIPTEEEFREEAIAFLDAHASRRTEERSGWGEGSDQVALFPEKTLEEELAEVERAKEWARAVYDNGFGWISGPERYGGRALPRNYESLYDAAERSYAVPSQVPRGIGLGMIAPTILAHGTEPVRDRYLKALYRGDIIACQLFSEPSSGSDLASVQSRCVRDGDEWVLNGQKVWTSGAHYSDIGEILCRTDPEAPKHRGLSAFVVDMHAPGVEVRPLRQMTGGATFNEVFFTDVRIPADHLLGDVNGGWTVALTTLMNERAAIGGGGGGLATGHTIDRLIDLLRHTGHADDPGLRQLCAEIFINARVSSYTSMRAMAKIKAGQLPGPEMSIAKLSLTENLQRIAALASGTLGMRLTADSGEWGTYAWGKLVLGVPGMRVAGGTDEVMRNIVAERVLGLPKEPAPVS